MEAEDNDQGRAEDGDEQVGEGISESLIMKQKKDTPMPPPGMPHPELEEPEEIWTLTSLGPPCMPTLPTFHSVSDAALVAKYRAERVKDPRMKTRVEKKAKARSRNVRTASEDIKEWEPVTQM